MVEKTSKKFTKKTSASKKADDNLSITSGTNTNVSIPGGPKKGLPKPKVIQKNKVKPEVENISEIKLRKNKCISIFGDCYMDLFAKFTSSNSVNHYSEVLGNYIYYSSVLKSPITLTRDGMKSLRKDCSPSVEAIIVGATVNSVDDLVSNINVWCDANVDNESNSSPEIMLALNFENVSKSVFCDLGNQSMCEYIAKIVQIQDRKLGTRSKQLNLVILPSTILSFKNYLETNFTSDEYDLSICMSNYLAHSKHGTVHPYYLDTPRAINADSRLPFTEYWKSLNLFKGRTYDIASSEDDMVPSELEEIEIEELDSKKIFDETIGNTKEVFTEDLKKAVFRAVVNDKTTEGIKQEDRQQMVDKLNEQFNVKGKQVIISSNSSNADKDGGRSGYSSNAEAEVICSTIVSAFNDATRKIRKRRTIDSNSRRKNDTDLEKGPYDRLALIRYITMCRYVHIKDIWNQISQFDLTDDDN